MQTLNLKELRALRSQEKSTKARLAIIKPLAEEEAKIIQPNGGKFTVEGVGDFVLDKDPVLSIETSTSKIAVKYRKLAKEQQALKSRSAELTQQMRGLYDAFKKKYGPQATTFTWTLKCIGID